MRRSHVKPVLILVAAIAAVVSRKSAGSQG